MGELLSGKMKADSLESLTMRLERKGFRFALSPECPQMETLLAVVAGQREPERFFRPRGRRRAVMLAAGMVVKLYAFHTLADLLHSGRYAPREVECYHDYVKAFGALDGFRLPKLLGYFEKPLLGGIYRANGIVSEFVPDTHEMSCPELMCAVPLFAHLYRKGIYHPDMQLKNILYQTATPTVVPIDYMGCNILPAPNWEALLISVAHFLKTGKVPPADGEVFLQNILRALPELQLEPARAWRCVTRIWDLKITSHQYHRPVFLPPELRREAASEV